MKACRACGRLYPDDAGFCQADGQELYNATDVPVPSDDADPRVGQLMFERYQVRRVIADGGMGRVYEALDLQQKRHVAVKVLHDDVATDVVSVERFKREFEVSRLLPNLHIVDVVGFHTSPAGTHALVMEYLYGEELRSTLKREKRLSAARALRMVSQVALGLDEAHGKQLVHRDLKPDNIFLCQTSDGDISKVLDFGSVKDKAENAKKLTALGTTIGSPYYMSPEQAQGLETLDSRADVWALGAIFYECITGAVPFNGINGPSILLEILTKEPTVPSQVPGAPAAEIPPALDRAVLGALKKSVISRTPTVGRFADALGHAYGLAGDHRVWAQTPQVQLEQLILQALPSAMAAEVPTTSDLDDDFFSEEDGVGITDAMDAAFARAHRPPALESALDAPAVGVGAGVSEYALPTKSPGWLVPALAVGVLAAVAVAVAML